MKLSYVLTAALVLGVALPVMAADSFLIIKDQNKHCRVIENNVVSEDQMKMQVGKQSYPTREEANIDVKVICDGS
jgi:hypothetical protein